MNVLASIGVDPIGFSKLLSSKLYAQIRLRMEYGLAINLFSSSQFQQLENNENKCTMMIYGTYGRTSTKITLHLANLPTMNERVCILPTQFFFRFLYVPDDSLLGFFSHMYSTLESISGLTSLKLPFGNICLLFMTT